MQVHFSQAPLISRGPARILVSYLQLILPRLCNSWAISFATILEAAGWKLDTGK